MQGEEGAVLPICKISNSITFYAMGLEESTVTPRSTLSRRSLMSLIQQRRIKKIKSKQGSFFRKQSRNDRSHGSSRPDPPSKPATRQISSRRASLVLPMSSMTKGKSEYSCEDSRDCTSSKSGNNASKEAGLRSEETTEALEWRTLMNKI